jgi:methylthioribulose-1-phosphate dehydratase
MNLEKKHDTLKLELSETIKKYHLKGWSPATSTNYSFKEQNKIYVSRSGIDKSLFTEEDFICVDENGQLLSEKKDIKPSAETLIHCVLYELFQQTTVVLHSHSIYSVINSQKYSDLIHFNGYEIQKGFEGQTTHENTVSIPIVDNSQNMNEIVLWMKNNKNLLENHCFIIRNHGTYAWGKNLFQAKRHLETIEYLLELNWKLNH